jgi:hypothetical protein
MAKIAVTILLLLVAALTFACKKAPQAEAPTETTEPLHSLTNTPSPPPVNVVHGSFNVSSFTKFEFEVPAHSITPKVEGTFDSTDGRSGASANIDLLIMTPEEFEELSHGRSGTAAYSVTGARSQTIAYALPSTLDSSQKYFVVFQNPAGKSSPRTVKAEITASF